MAIPVGIVSFTEEMYHQFFVSKHGIKMVLIFSKNLQVLRKLNERVILQAIVTKVDFQ